MWLLLAAHGALAGTIINTNLPVGTEIVNIDATADGVGSYSGDIDQSFFYSPTPTAPSVTFAPGTYEFRILDATDAVALFPALTSMQQSEIYTAWTYNTPWTEDYLAFDSDAATNSTLNQIFDGALEPGIPNDQTFGTAQGAYDGTIANGYYDKIRPAPPGRSGTAADYLTSYTFTVPTTVLFVVPDNILGDNAGGVSLLINEVPEPSTITALGVGGLVLILALRHRRRSVA